MVAFIVKIFKHSSWTKLHFFRSGQHMSYVLNVFQNMAMMNTPSPTEASRSFFGWNMRGISIEIHKLNLHEYWHSESILQQK